MHVSHITWIHNGWIQNPTLIKHCTFGWMLVAFKILIKATPMPPASVDAKSFINMERAAWTLNFNTILQMWSMPHAYEINIPHYSFQAHSYCWNAVLAWMHIAYTESITWIFNSCFRFHANFSFCCCSNEIHAQTTSGGLVLFVYIRCRACILKYGAHCTYWGREGKIGQVNKKLKRNLNENVSINLLFTCTAILTK